MPPRLVRLAPPAYPPAARRLRREATVELEVTVDADGSVVEARPVGTRAGFGFDEAAREAARHAVYRPATRGGVPVEATTRLTLRFVLD